ncbi:hypothetical protein BKA70DRAFT_176202 [Coprinopsis sp. MPI-PUGE-AT-0042]|nr:hypothetical protein BKA70DRAFT_176202 [Coprinopsis sp. MPI-PUGE-AT-0042]
MQLILLAIFYLLKLVIAVPAGRRHRQRAVAPDNVVSINGPDNYCLIVPKEEHTEIGESEQPGGTTTYCSSNARYDDTQGEIPAGFWSQVDHATRSGVNGNRYTQLTGCINPEVLDRLSADDEGGQYDSSGGSEGIGNPEYSVCTGYSHYVELIEPLAQRACIRCCDDPDDCPTKLDTLGCPAVIPGAYFDCE